MPSEEKTSQFYIRKILKAAKHIALMSAWKFYAIFILKAASKCVLIEDKPAGINMDATSTRGFPSGERRDHPSLGKRRQAIGKETLSPRRKQKFVYLVVNSTFIYFRHTSQFSLIIRQAIPVINRFNDRL